MFYISVIFFIFVLLLDLLFYIPFTIHFYIDDDSVYLYFFTISILVIGENKYVNKLENKLSFDKAKKDDFKMIESLEIKKINISLNNNIALKYPQMFYSLFVINTMSNKINYKISKKNKLYIKINIKLVNIVKQLIKIRRLNNERTSN